MSHDKIRVAIIRVSRVDYIREGIIVASEVTIDERHKVYRFDVHYLRYSVCAYRKIMDNTVNALRSDIVNKSVTITPRYNVRQSTEEEALIREYFSLKIII